MDSSLGLDPTGLDSSRSPIEPPAKLEPIAAQVPGCTYLSHTLAGYPAQLPQAEAHYWDESTQPRLAQAIHFLDIAASQIIYPMKWEVREVMWLAAMRSRAVGNADAADHLEHFLDNSGADLWRGDVDRLLAELPVLQDHVQNTLKSSANSLIQQDGQVDSNCQVFSQITPWILVGLDWRTPVNIHPHVDNDLSPFGSGFRYLYGGKDYPYRAELDWYLAMSPFYYAIDEHAILNTTTQLAEVCYRVYIYFPYRWIVDDSTDWWTP